jgi:hypothetical protein
MKLMRMAVVAACMGSAAAFAQNNIVPEGASQGVYSTQQSPPNAPFARMPSMAVQAGPNHSPLQQQGLPPTVPFGHASPDALIPAPVGPRSVTAAPVEGIDAGDVGAAEISSGELPAAEDSAVKVPAPSGAVFAAPKESDAPMRGVLRVLNKVTAQYQEFILNAGQEVLFGQLVVGLRACRTSTPESMPEHAALLLVEKKIKNQVVSDGDAEAPQKPEPPLFYGWMFASSPSLSGLESPVYDISLVRCEPLKGKAAAAKPKQKEKPKA